ncbi:hypothetical protein [Mycobacterium lacus]|nr:hypothetical protein [Mycobacterium lacus]
MDRRAELFGGGQPPLIGVDVVDMGPQRRPEGRHVQPDRQPADHQGAALGRFQCGQLRPVATLPPWIGISIASA